MNIRSLSGVLAPSKSYVCSYCRPGYVAFRVRRIRRYQHTISQPVENVANSVLIDNASNNLGENVNSRTEKDPPSTIERYSARTDADDRVD